MSCLKLLLAIFLTTLAEVLSSQWLSIALSGSVQNFRSKKNCDDIGKILNSRQFQLCKRKLAFMDSVKGGASLALKTCQHQFKFRRWNCTTVDFSRSPVFGNSANGGTREAGFVHAISAAGVAYAVTRACSAGKLGNKCGCDTKYRGDSKKGFEWAGCSDNIKAGMKFSRDFVDARERGRKVGGPARVLMNLHNNEAGRQSISENMRLECKCHGVSGNCNIKTCWRVMPPFDQVGAILKDKFDGASEVVRKVVGSHSVLEPKNQMYKPFTISDLVYIDSSPDFCNEDPKTGSLGTQGRQCNRTSQAIDGCDLMCCNRGYRTKKVVRKERCGCKFYWCCHVRCKECLRKVEVSHCK